MTVHFGIASYKRPESQRTLSYLERLGVDKSKIIVSVQTRDDKAAYEDAGIAERVGSLVYREGRNVSDNRNALLDSVPDGSRIVLMDDDIKAVCRLSCGVLHPVESPDELEALITRGYALAAKHHTVGFGLYPVKNAYFMSPGYASRSICIGTMLGLTTISGMRFDPAFSTKEDYEYCCKAINRYGAFIRLNDAVCDAQHYSKGGCEDFWNDTSTVRDTARRLVGRYPGILELNSKKPGEVRMIRKGASNK